jgi:CTP:phosphocholine cytidylyltransferase-like protein
MQKKDFDVLVLLEQSAESMTQRRIATELNISVGAVNKIVKSLTDEGLITNGKITAAGVEALEPYRVKRAIFLAAGFGSRMVPLTFNTPKPLVRVHGTRMIDTLLDAVVAAGITEIVVVRGYLGEQFDQLLYKYPMIKFVENPLYNEANNISSAMMVRYLFQNAYVLEADLVLSNPKLIRKYEYASNFLGIPVEVTDDWCLYTDKNGYVIEQCVGGRDCYQMIGISYWNAEAGAKLANDLDEVYRSPGGKERYWEQVALLYKKKNYKVSIRPCKAEDVVEIDSYNELKQIDKLYADK